jgi:hypothetical protein
MCYGSLRQKSVIWFVWLNETNPMNQVNQPALSLPGRRYP